VCVPRPAHDVCPAFARTRRSIHRLEGAHPIAAKLVPRLRFFAVARSCHRFDNSLAAVKYVLNALSWEQRHTACSTRQQQCPRSAFWPSGVGARDRHNHGARLAGQRDLHGCRHFVDARCVRAAHGPLRVGDVRPLRPARVLRHRRHNSLVVDDNVARVDPRAVVHAVLAADARAAVGAVGGCLSTSCGPQRPRVHNPGPVRCTPAVTGYAPGIARPVWATCAVAHAHRTAFFAQRRSARSARAAPCVF